VGTGKPSRVFLKAQMCSKQMHVIITILRGFILPSVDVDVHAFWLGFAQMFTSFLC